MTKKALQTLLFLIVSSGLMGCAASAVRPDQIDTAKAVGEGFKCTAESVLTDHDHFIVSWSDDTRAALETAMSRGVAVVKYDCSGVQVLKACSAEGNYDYSAVSKKTKLVEMKDSGSIQANLGGNVSLPAKFSAELSQGRQLNLAYILIGAQAVSNPGITRADLTGRCDGATHFVFETQLGAFVLATGEQGHAYAAAELFDYGSASGELDSEKSVRSTDGEVDSCEGSTESDEAPTPGCKALLRAALLKID